MIDDIKVNFYKKETILSPIATRSSEAVRLKEEESDFRTPFFRDVDRIINYSSYTRYSNKTQVFSFLDNDIRLLRCMMNSFQLPYSSYKVFAQLFYLVFP